MRTIRQQIAIPFFILSIAMPLSIVILFNFIATYQSRLQAEQDLQVAVSAISESITADGAKNIATLIKTQTQATSAELLVFNDDGSLSKIAQQSESFASQDLIARTYQELQTLAPGAITSFSFEGDTYYMASVDYEGRILNNHLVYLTKGLVLDEFVTAMNIILLLISLAIALLGVLFSSRMTKKVAAPIERLTTLVETIQSDQILVIDDQSNCLELSKLTQEVNHLNQRIYQANASQKSFLQNASHELRTPLMSIQGYADGIEMGVFQDYKGTAHLISDQSKRLTKLVDGLLHLARAENFNANKKLEPLNLSDCMADLMHTYQGYAHSQNIALTATLTPAISLLGNQELLTASVGNIISNALRYATTQVTVSLVQQDSHAVITITDDGQGIENMEQIFEKFYKGAHGNFGLGLSIAKTAVEVMHGHIQVANTPGAQFTLTFPTLPQ